MTGPDLFRPELFRPQDPADRVRLEDLLKREQRLQVSDRLMPQLAELVRSLNPSRKFDKTELEAAARAHAGDTPLHLYGVWVYYPWSHRLVHLLDEQEFALVRTDRNRNKITREEQAVLGRQRIGVIGLSVGQSVALTLALERGFGELRLADFDTLDLSNLNRIRSGVHHLGVNKAVNVAREIAELDPFLKVTLFQQGLRPETMDDFFTGDGKLDILVEECDSVDIKILARQKAKELGIPVIMDTSDRGLIDVERFDLEPERPILHGLVDHLDLSLAAKAKTNEEKLPFVIPVLGLDTLSTRMKASMLEIENSVLTWPQLASSVTMGGAMVAELCRRVALGQPLPSGRWFIDLDDLITGGGPAKSTSPVPERRFPELTEAGLQHLVGSLDLSPAPRPFSAEQARSIVEAAVHAPSAGNLQPWRFIHHAGRILVVHDQARGSSQLDGGQLIPSIDLGTAVENMVLRAAELGLPTTAEIHTEPGTERLIAEVSAAEGQARPDPLHAHLTQRCTNRRKATGGPFAPAAMEALAKAVTAIPGCQVHFATGPDLLHRAAAAVGAAERMRVLNPIGHQELLEGEIRWSQSEALTSRDGLDLPTLELKLAEQVGFRVARDQKAIALLREWNGGKGFMKGALDGIRSGSAVALVSVPRNDRRALLDGGRAVQRLWLQATAEGLSAHPVSAPLLLAHHVRHGGGSGFDPNERDELLRLFRETCAIFAMTDREPVFMLRLGLAEPPTERSLRRPVESMFQSFSHVPSHPTAH